MAKQHFFGISGRLAGQVIALLVVLVGSPLQAHADRYHLFPGKALDGRTVSAQHKVESLYSSGDFTRAFLIYRKELAPIGDKYAQYMVGYMRLHGQGVEKNPAEALAWYRLAAERGESVWQSHPGTWAAGATTTSTDACASGWTDAWLT